MTIFATIIGDGDTNALASYSEYLTVGKRYQVIGEEPPHLFTIADDDGEEIDCLFGAFCAHLISGFEWERSETATTSTE